MYTHYNPISALEDLKGELKVPAIVVDAPNVEYIKKISKEN